MRKSRRTEPHSMFLPAGETLQYVVRAFDQFISIRGSISSRPVEFFGLAFASPKTAVAVCRNCGFGHWFLGPVSANELRRRGRSRP